MGGLESDQVTYMAAFSGNDPPIEDLPFCSKFSIREIFQKSRFFCTDSVGARPKMKEFWKNFESGQEIFLTKKVPVFNGDFRGFGP